MYATLRLFSGNDVCKNNSTISVTASRLLTQYIPFRDLEQLLLIAASLFLCGSWALCL